MDKKPSIMFISKLSGVQERLNFLAQGLVDEKSAETDKVYIECFKAGSKSPTNTVLFSSDLGISSDVTTVDSLNGAILEKSIAVNMFDLFNIVSVCDEIISLYIDSESNELVIGSYYNKDNDFDELEVRLPILAEGFVRKHHIPKDSEKILAAVTLDNIIMYSMIKELDIQNRSEGIVFDFKNGSFSLESSIPGLDVRYFIKSQEAIKYPNDFSRFIPMSLFKLIVGSGEMQGVTFNFYADYVYVDTSDYDFCYMYTKEPIIIQESSENAEDGFVIDVEQFQFHLKLLNQLHASSPDGGVVFERVQDGEADISAEYPGRYNATSRARLAMLTEKPIRFNGALFFDLFDKSGLDAIAIKILPNGTIYNSIENYLIRKEMFYRHEEYIGIGVSHEK